MRRYGITTQDRDDMVVKQKGMCAICGLIPSGVLHVDHIRILGVVKVRGLLCGNCNKALGLIYDNPETLKRMIEYVSKL